MTRRIIVLAALCLVVSRPAVAEYRSVEVEALKITVDSDWVQYMAPGYLPVRFDITNLGETRVIEIVAHSSRYFSSMRSAPGSLDLRQELKLARGDRVRFTLPVPVLTEVEDLYFEVRESGRRLQRFGAGAGISGKPLYEASALLVIDPNGALNNRTGVWPRRLTITSRSIAVGASVMPGSMAGPTPNFDFTLEPARLPTSWLGYSSVRAVVLGDAEWRAMSDAQRAAVVTWVAAGGDLILVDVDLKTVIPNAAPLATDGGKADYFFGHVHMWRSTEIDAKGLGTVLAIAQPSDDTWPWSLPANRAADWATFTPSGFRIAIPGVNRVPARGYLAILIAFAIVIGPLNWIVLRRRSQQVLLVLTTPLISAAFLLVLGGYVAAAEGFRVPGTAVTFTILDQGRKLAATRATASFRNGGLTRGGGLTVSRDVAVYPLVEAGSAGEPQRLDLTDTQHFSAGVIRTRAASNVETVSVRPARERVAVKDDGGHLTVVNGLGVPITQLVYKQGGRRFILDAPLAIGKTGTLKPGEYTEPIPARLASVFTDQPDGTYLAIAERSPFWEPGVTRVDERGSFHAILGIMEPIP